MKTFMKKLLFIPILFLAFKLEAGDRFGYIRNEVPRSSYTESGTQVNVLIASAPSASPNELGGNIILRSVIISGYNPSTITFYDTQRFNEDVSTRTKVYWPGNAVPVEINFNQYYSSGLMNAKTDAGGVSLQTNWDYTQPPKFSGGQGFNGVGK